LKSMRVIRKKCIPPYHDFWRRIINFEFKLEELTKTKFFKFFSLFLLFSIWILLSSCTSKIDLEKEKGNLLKTDIEFSKTSVERGAADAFYLYLADDAVQLPAGLPLIVGREKIRESMSGSSKAVLKWEPVKAEVAKSGDLGYTWGELRD